MKKIVLFLGLIFFITGCSVNYNVTIGDNLKVTEEAMIEGGNDLYNIYYKTDKVSVLKEILDGYTEILQENHYTSKVIENEEPLVNISKEYTNIEEFLKNSKLFNDYFDEINYNRDGDIIKIETVGFNPNNEDNPDRFNVLNLDIAITSKYRVKKSNATKVDKKNNTFHFIMDKDTTDFQIMMEIDASKEFNKMDETIRIIIITIVVTVLAWIIIFYVNRKRVQRGD